MSKEANRIFVQTANQTVNTLLETSLFGAGVGSLLLPANYLEPGRSLTIMLWGYINSTATLLPTTTIRAKLGSTVIGNTNATALVASLVQQLARIQLDITCRSAGVNGQVICAGSFSYAAPNGQMFSNQMGINNLAPVTVNTTIAQTLDLTMQFGGLTVLGANNITTTIGTVRRI